MPENFPGPFEVELFYTANGNEHVARINCNTGSGVPVVGTNPTAIDLLLADGTNKTLQTAVQEYADLFKVWLNTSDSVDGFDFYAYLTPGGARQYVTSGVLGISGTSGSSAVIAHQTTWTFKTQEGNTMRMVLMELVLGGNTRRPYSSISTTEQGFMDYIAADDTWIMARDTSYPVVPRNQIGGQNEALFKRTYR